VSGLRCVPVFSFPAAPCPAPDFNILQTSPAAGSTLWTGRMPHGAPNGGRQSRISALPAQVLPAGLLPPRQQGVSLWLTKIN